MKSGDKRLKANKNSKFFVPDPAFLEEVKPAMSDVPLEPELTPKCQSPAREQSSDDDGDADSGNESDGSKSSLSVPLITPVKEPEVVIKMEKDSSKKEKKV